MECSSQFVRTYQIYSVVCNYCLEWAIDDSLLFFSYEQNKSLFSQLLQTQVSFPLLSSALLGFMCLGNAYQISKNSL